MSKVYSINSRKRVIRMEKVGEETLVTKGDGKKKLMKFKKSIRDKKSPYKRKSYEDYIGREKIKALKEIKNGK